MTRHKRISIVITTVFGFIYIMANAQLLPASEATAVRAVGILAAAGLLIGLPRPDRPDPPGVGFSRPYWLIVAAEVAAGIGGLLVLNDVLGIHDASIAWISVVVGVHFFGFYVIWRLPVMVWIGAAITICGVIGLLVAGMDRSAALIAVVAGIVPGAVLLAGGYWSRFHPLPGRAATRG
jgi:hypothetical protein